MGKFISKGKQKNEKVMKMIVQHGKSCEKSMENSHRTINGEVEFEKKSKFTSITVNFSWNECFLA